MAQGGEQLRFGFSEEPDGQSIGNNKVYGNCDPSLLELIKPRPEEIYEHAAEEGNALTLKERLELLIGPLSRGPITQIPDEKLSDKDYRAMYGPKNSPGKKYRKESSSEKDYIHPVVDLETWDVVHPNSDVLKKLKQRGRKYVLPVKGALIVKRSDQGSEKRWKDLNGRGECELSLVNFYFMKDKLDEILKKERTISSSLKKELSAMSYGELLSRLVSITPGTKLYEPYSREDLGFLKDSIIALPVTLPNSDEQEFIYIARVSDDRKTMKRDYGISNSKKTDICLINCWTFTVRGGIALFNTNFLRII